MKAIQSSILCWILILGLTLCKGNILAEPVVSLTTDKENAIYSCGEPATFTLKVTENDSPVTSGTIQIKLEVAGGKTLLQRSVNLAEENPMTFKGTLNEPGFLLATATGLPDAKRALAGAGFDPDRILPGNTLPADFHTFWKEGRAALADRPVKLEKIDSFSNEEYTSYAVTVEVLHGEHLYGFLSVPRSPGKFPAIVIIPGAGAGYVTPNTNWAKRGVISLVMNVHKFPVILNDAEANKRQYQEHMAKINYPKDQADNKDLYHFRNVILGIDRMITEVANRPDWDGQHLVMDGSSQGGGLSLILSGLNPHITAVAANVPALCDHGGSRLGRQPGWPNLSALGPQALEVSAYYDVANFAPDIHCPALVSAGFIDTTCPPASVYAAWNRIPEGKKTIIPMPRQGHETPPIYISKKNPWIDHQLGLKSITSQQN